MGLSNAELGLILVTVAGSATGLGAAVVFSERLVQLASKPFLAGALGVSTGVMLYVSFVEIFVKSLDGFHSSSAFGESDAYLAATAALFAGMAFMGALDTLVHWLDPNRTAHHASDPRKHMADPVPDVAPCCALDDATFEEIERRGAVLAAGAPAAADDCEAEAPAKLDPTEHKRLESMGVMTALAIGIHNFPEGLATFVATLDDPAVGASLAIAIAIHNIPEGLCVAIPIYFATGDRWKAFRWACLSGVSEIVGALLGWAILKDHFDNMLYGVVFGLVGGMMIMICLNELIPTAHRYDPQDKVVTKSIVAGMAVMAASLCLFIYG